MSPTLYNRGGKGEDLAISSTTRLRKLIKRHDLHSQEFDCIEDPLLIKRNLDYLGRLPPAEIIVEEPEIIFVV